VTHLFGIVEEDDEYYYIDDLMRIGSTLKFSSFYVRWPKSKGLGCAQEEIARALNEVTRRIDNWVIWGVIDFQWIGEKVHGFVAAIDQKE